MENYNFKEQKEEYSAKHGKKIPVWITPNYEAAKAKAIEIIESKKYGVTESDFWILMNATKNEKMPYFQQKIGIKKIPKSLVLLGYLF